MVQTGTLIHCKDSVRSPLPQTSIRFYRLDALPAAQPTVTVKALKAAAVRKMHHQLLHYCQLLLLLNSIPVLASVVE